MVLMTAFLLEQWKKAGKINGKQFIGSTIVSTPMMMELATNYEVECKIGLTGFKWIAKMIKDFQTRLYWWWRRKLWLYERRCVIRMQLPQHC
jgi:phosphomannomutase